MQTYGKQAHLLKSIAHPVRLHILDLLLRADECVCHLSATLGKSQPYVSQQLAVLRNAGLIVDRKDGNNVYYGVADRNAATLLGAIVGPLCGDDRAAAPTGHVRVMGCRCPKCGEE